ncbi:Rnf130 [Symbiodinium pilosum]|uniref:Rnf130 protein n=1 Tax=Symbiodinium pilosum TaxID=2952 RepID=A0A812WI84_SYMPI|nr:Rnf130 [Symbiodinium pilosum]
MPAAGVNAALAQQEVQQSAECVAMKCEEHWGWSPSLTGSGPNSGGPYNTYGAGHTIIGAETPSGKWQFILYTASPQVPLEGSVTAQSSHKGWASSDQQTDLIRFAEECFSSHAVDVSSPNQQQATLHQAAQCIPTKCEESWGWSPQLTGFSAAEAYSDFGEDHSVLHVETPRGTFEVVLFFDPQAEP